MNFDRSKIPQSTEEIKFTLPEIQSFLLSNGLNILFVQRDFLPIIRMNLITYCGSIFDPIGKSGLANLFSMVIDEGAGDYNSLELSEEFEVLGSSFNSSCNHDNVVLSIQSLSEHFDRTLELLSTIILRPQFNDPDFHREKRKVEVKLLQQKDEPEELADQAFAHLIYGGNNSYSVPILGYENSINEININEIRNYYNNNFTPEKSCLIVVGNLSKEKLIDLLEKYLNDWKNKSKMFAPKFEQLKNKKMISVLNKEGAVQTEIRVGHQSSKRNSSDYYPKFLMNMILGGQFTSRINLNLRERKGFTYGATSSFSYYKNSGEFCVSTSVSTENTYATVKEILFELEKIKQGATKQELDFTRSSVIRKFPSQFESDWQIASNLSSLAIHNLPYDYFNTYIDKIKNVSEEEVNRAAVENIKLKELSIVLVGDEKKLMDLFTASEIGKVQIINSKGEIIS